MNNSNAVISRGMRFRAAQIPTLLLIVMLFGGTCMVIAQSASDVPAMETPEPYAVGLKVVNQYDYSRNY